MIGPRGPRRAALLHHRGHRLPRHGPGRAPAPEVPDCEVVLLVRPGRRAAPAAGARRRSCKNDCFDRLRARARRPVRRRDRPPGSAPWPATSAPTASASTTTGGALLASCDMVIHSAATVSFDSPLDAAVEVNLLGPSRVAAAVAEARADGPADGTGRAEPPHRRLHRLRRRHPPGRGHARSSSTATPSPSTSTGGPRWRPPAGSAADLRPSPRTPEPAWPEFAQGARSELGRRRHSTCWPNGPNDCARTGCGTGWSRPARPGPRPSAGPTPTPTPRPWASGRSTTSRGRRSPSPSSDPRSSSPRWPSPGPGGSAASGWPSRSSSPTPGACSRVPGRARGHHRRHPGRSGGGRHPRRGRRRGPRRPSPPVRVQVASGVRNPLRYRQLVDLVRAWFTEHPVYDSRRPAHRRARVVVPRAGPGPAPAAPGHPGWSWPSAWSARCPCGAARRAGWRPSRSATPGRAGARLRRALRRLHRDRGPLPGRPPARAVGPPGRGRPRRFCFDPGVIDWDRYVQEVHLPSVVEHARVRTTPTEVRPSRDRSERARKAILSPERHLAVFDLENTLIASNVVDSYAWLASRHLPAGRAGPLRRRPVREAPRLLALDRRDRGDFLRYFYRRYEGAPVDALRRGRWELFQRPPPGQVVPGRHPPGPRAPGPRPPHPAHHRRPRRGDRAAAPALRRHRLRPPRRAATAATPASSRSSPDRRGPGPDAGRLRRGRTASTSSESVAYADSASDLPMLEAVGFPVAVNPETKLAAIARKRGWHVEHWPKAPGGARPCCRSAPSTSRPAGPSGRPRRRRTATATPGGPMKALVFERNLPRFAAAWVASCSARAAGRRRSAPPARHRSPGTARTDWHRSRRCSRASAAATWPPWTADLALVRGPRELPVRARPRGRRHVATARRGAVDHAGVSLAAGAGWSSSRCSAAPPGASTPAARPAPPAAPAPASTSRRPPAPGLQTGYCADTGGGLVDGRPGRPRAPAPRGARRP